MKDPRSNACPIHGLPSTCLKAAPPKELVLLFLPSFLVQMVMVRGGPCPVPGVSGVTGSALRETACINRSLAALADVLGALSEHRSHIPYRNSRLTHLLQDCLGNRFPPNPPRWDTTCPRTRAHTSSLHILEGHPCTPCTSCALAVASWHSRGTVVILLHCLTSAWLLACSVCV